MTEKEYDPADVLVIMGWAIMAVALVLALVFWDFVILLPLGGWAALYLICGYALKSDDRDNRAS